MNNKLLIIFIFLSIKLDAQTKTLATTNNFNKPSTADTYFVHLITLNQLDSLVNNNDKLVIQFFQPWCGGVEYWIQRLDSLQSFLAERKIPFYLIMDTRREDNYFEIQDKKVGMVVYYFMRYKIKFPSYIIGRNEKLKTYRREIEKLLKSSVSKNSFGIYIKNKKIIYQEGSYNFYEKIFNRVMENN